MSKGLILWELMKKGAERFSCTRTKAQMKEAYRAVFGDNPLSSYNELRIAQTMYNYAYAMDRNSSLLGAGSSQGQSKQLVEEAAITLMCNTDEVIAANHEQVARLYGALYEINYPDDMNDLTAVKEMRADMPTILNYYS